MKDTLKSGHSNICVTMSYSYHCETRRCFLATLFNFALAYAVRGVQEDFKGGVWIWHISFLFMLVVLTFFITYSLTPYSSPSWEANQFSASPEIPHILQNPKVHYRIHKYPHLSLSLASSIQSTPPHPTSWKSICILSSHLRLGLASGLFPSGFPTITLYKTLLSPIRATCPTHLILLDFITRVIQVNVLIIKVCHCYQLQTEFIWHSSLKCNSIRRLNYWGSSVWILS